MAEKAKNTQKSVKNEEKNTKKSTKVAEKEPKTAKQSTKVAEKEPKTAKKTQKGVKNEEIRTKKVENVVKSSKKATKVAEKAAKKPTNSTKSAKNDKKVDEKVAKAVTKSTKPAKNETKNAKKDTKSAKKPAKIAKNVLNKKGNKTEKVNEPKQIAILGFHDLPLCTYLFEDVKNPKAVVLVIHGMQEHCLRYRPFAEFLNSHGYIVILSDLRGHGRTMQSPDDYGRGEKDIFAESVQDQLRLIDFANAKYSLPIYVFGHSYGSMLTQKLVQLTPHIQKAVICGTANGSNFLFTLGSPLVSALRPFNSKDKRGGLAEKLCIKSYGKGFERGNWLTRDEAVFDKYLADDLCGGSFPFSFYHSLVKNMHKINSGIDKIGDKKLFLIAGDKDPVGEQGKQVQKLHKIYLKNNIDSKLKLYPDARHELLNELNKEEVYEDILNFFEN